MGTKKVIITSLIIAFLNYLIGCHITSSEKADIQDLSLADETVTEVVLLNGDVLLFGEQGGSYLMRESILLGNDIMGQQLIIPLESIQELRLTIPPSAQLSEIGDTKIIELVTDNNRVHKTMILSNCI